MSDLKNFDNGGRDLDKKNLGYSIHEMKYDFFVHFVEMGCVVAKTLFSRV